MDDFEAAMRDVEAAKKLLREAWQRAREAVMQIDHTGPARMDDEIKVLKEDPDEYYRALREDVKEYLV